MDKPTKPTDLMPRTFGGLKENYSTSLQQTGVEPNVPVIYHGKNFNYEKNAIGQELDYCEKIADFINALPIGKGITVDSNNKLVYADYGTDITGKANISLDNLNANGKARIAVKEYLVTETYIQGDVVLAIIDDKVKLFKSLIDNNTGNALSDDTKWEEVQLGGSGRNVGEIITSTLPLTDAGLHLLDGTRLSGDGIYKEFVDNIADLYNDTKVYNPDAFTVVGSPTITEDGILTSSNPTGGNGLIIPTNLIGTKPFVIKFRATRGNFITGNWFVGNSNVNSIFTGWVRTSSIIQDLRVRVYNDNTSTESILSFGEVTIPVGKTFDTILSWDGSVYTLKMIDANDETVYKDTIVESSLSINTNIQRLVELNTLNTGITYDLKQFSITVDGVEVFSGSTPANYFTDETTWQASVSQYGSCGKFVYDSTNNTVRLPKVSDILQGTTDINALGDLVASGLPQHTHTRGTMDIQGSISVYAGGSTTSDGALRWTRVNGTNNAGSGDTLGTRTLTLKASNNWTGSTSNANYTSITATTSKVQPQTIKCFVYIVIATSSKTDIQVDIDNIATDLNGKADTGLTNVTDSAKVLMSGMGMPSNKYVNLTLGASDSTYTAPANGYFYLQKIATSTTQVLLMINSGKIGSLFTTNDTNRGVQAYIPVSKGDTLSITYSLGGATTIFRFVYAAGSESEAQ